LLQQGFVYCHFTLIATTYMKTVFASVLLSTMMLSMPASAQSQRVRLVTPSHLPQATDAATIYTASCGTGQYQLIVTPAKKTVILRASQRPDLDLSTSTVGLRLLDKETLVQVGFNCPMDAINIFLRGVKLADLAMPTGFRDSISIRGNGDMISTHPEDVAIDALATPPNGVSVVPVPQH
jgi:hypothetical protein